LRIDDLVYWTPSFVQPSRNEGALANNTIGWLTTMVVRVPTFRLYWFKPQGAMDEEMQRDVLGRTFPMHEPPVVMLLTGMPDAEVVRVTAHEVKHVLDAPQARRGLSNETLEARARNFEAQWTPPLLQKFGLAARATSVEAAPEIHPLWASHVVYR